MKLLIALLVVSALTLKVVRATVANNEDCSAQGATCTDDNAECKDDSNGGEKCLCKVNYAYDANTACKLVGGQDCTDDTKTDCASGECTDDKCEGKEDNGAACTINAECKSFNCKWEDGTEKCAAAAPATVVASLTLMLMTLVTTHFL